MRNHPSVVLTIAGSDSSGGAGIQADIKTISATGSYAASVITVVTAQNTLGVQAIFDVSAEFVALQIQSVLDDIDVKAIKIGMLHNKEIILAVTDILSKYAVKHVVIDPVMLSKNGCALLDENVIELLQQQLFPLATLITPNLPEAEKLLGITITNSEEQEQAAITLGKQSQVNVLVKGGHLTGKKSADVVYLHRSASTKWFYANRIDSENTHGTGCSLSSAIASYLAQDYMLEGAIKHAKDYLTGAIDAGKEWQLGKGCGPVDHFFEVR